MATVNLGRVGIILRGIWSNVGAYKFLDIVSYNGSAYGVKYHSSDPEYTVPVGTLPTDATYYALICSKGDVGISAYQSAVAQGYVGTEAQWIASLKGIPGDPGANGAGFIPIAGTVLPASIGSPRFSIVPAGTYTRSGMANVVVTSAINIISDNGTIWTSAFGVPTGEVDKNYIQSLGLPNLVSRTIDFTPLTLSSVYAQEFYNDDEIVTEISVLDSVRIKTTAVGALVTMYEMNRVAGANAPTIVYTYPPFFTTSLEHIERITDKHQLAIGNFIGFKSDTATYYASQTGYGWSVGFTVARAQKRAYDVVLNRAVTKTLTDTILDNVSILSEVGLTPKSYPLAFEAFTQTAGNPSIIFRKSNQLTKEAFCIKARIKATIGAVVSVVVANIKTNVDSTLVAEILHTYAPITTTALNQSLVVDDGYVAPAGAYVGFSLATGSIIYYSNSIADDNYTVNKSTLLVTLSTTIRFAFDFTIYESDPFKLANQVSALQILTQSALLNRKSRLNKCILFKDEFSILTNFTASGWALVSGGASPLGVGSANSLFLNKKYHVDQRDLLIGLTLPADGIFAIDSATIDKTAGLGSVRINVATNTIGIYRTSGNALVAQQVLPFTWIAGRKYNVYLSRDYIYTYITILDTFLATSYTLKYQPTAATYIADYLQDEAYKFYLVSGTTAGCILERVVVTSKEGPLILYYGDSIDMCLGIAIGDAGNTHIAMINKYLNGNMFTSAMSSENIDGTILKMDTEAKFIKPKYVMHKIGTNPTNTEAKLTQLVTLAEAFGAKTIFNHIPAMSSGAHIAVNAQLDKVCRETNAIVGLRYDIPTSLNNDPAQGYNPALSQDGTHPVIAGLSLMGARFPIDLPMLMP